MNKVMGCFNEGAQLFFSTDDGPNVTVVLSFWEDVDDMWPYAEHSIDKIFEDQIFVVFWIDGVRFISPTLYYEEIKDLL